MTTEKKHKNTIFSENASKAVPTLQQKYKILIINKISVKNLLETVGKCWSLLECWNGKIENRTKNLDFRVFFLSLLTDCNQKGIKPAFLLTVFHNTFVFSYKL